jgi:hypothetical protein
VNVTLDRVDEGRERVSVIVEKWRSLRHNMHKTLPIQKLEHETSHSDYNP